VKLSPATLALVRAALREDLGTRGDVTTEFFVPKGARLSGRIVAKQAGVVCGVDIARRVFTLVDRGARVKLLKKDGARVRPGDGVLAVSGGPGLLTAERTALNFLQRMSGVATLTSSYAAKLKGTRTKVLDTRKTVPGWRELDKYAVRCGGGFNYRLGLYDAVLTKDNHWASGIEMEAAVRAARRKYPGIAVELEAADMEQVERALAAKADVILLDNMTPSQLRRAIARVRRAAKRTEIEISGGVTLENIGRLGRLGADWISVGRLTHSAPALDLSLEITAASRRRAAGR